MGAICQIGVLTWKPYTFWVQNGFIFGLFALRFQWLWAKSWFSLWIRSFPHLNTVKIVISPSEFWFLVKKKKWILAKMLCFVAFGHKHGRQERPLWAQKMHRFRVKTPIWQIQKNPRVRKIFCPQFWGRKWLRQFYGRLEKMRSLCRKKPCP